MPDPFDRQRPESAMPIYESDGQLASVYYGRTPSFSGMLRTKTYNNRRQNIGISDVSSNGTVLNHTYSYDVGSGKNNGHLAQLTDNVIAGNSQTFGYDSTNRISTASSQATSGSSCWGQSFAYDQLGNLTTETPTQCSAPSLSLGINANNQITNTGITYDANGNMTNDGNQTYTWDAENHIKSIGSTNYTYDGDGHRLMKSTSEITWYTPDGKPLAVTDSTGHNLHEYIYFDGRVIARRDPSGSVYYYFSDHTKSNRVFTDATGHTQQSTVYYPYGQEQVQGTADDYKFTSKRRDTESGIDYAHYRSYHPTLGRWLGTDPGPMILTRPQSLNRYNYVIGDPTNETDASGAETDCQATEGGYTGDCMANGNSGGFAGSDAGDYGPSPGLGASSFVDGAGATIDDNGPTTVSGLDYGTSTNLENGQVVSQPVLIDEGADTVTVNASDPTTNDYSTQNSSLLNLSTGSLDSAITTPNYAYSLSLPQITGPGTQLTNPYGNITSTCLIGAMEATGGVVQASAYTDPSVDNQEQYIRGGNQQDVEDAGGYPISDPIQGNAIGGGLAFLGTYAQCIGTLSR